MSDFRSVDSHPLRSLLYVPASNEKALTKATMLACDAVILDLEDSVAPEAKLAARRRAFEWIGAGVFGAKPVYIRVNGLDTAFAAEDLAGASQCKGLCGIIIPKIGCGADIVQVEAHLSGASAKLQVLAMIETPMACLNLREIAQTSQAEASRLKGFILGLNDLVKDTGIDPGPDRYRLQPLLLQSVLTGKSYGLAVYDGVFNAFRDESGFAAEAKSARAFGFTGKTLIHPNQIELTHLAFEPSEAELAAAHAIVSEFEKRENDGKGAINLDGRMIERLHLEAAKKLLGEE